MKLLHKIIFWSHLLAGVIGGTVIFIMSATGVILMYEHQLVEYAERDVREVVPPGANAQRMSLDELVAKARAQNPKAQPTGVVLRNEPTASVAVGFGREGATYVNPYTGAILGSESKLHDWFHDVVDWHRWLGTEGEGRVTARAITGACNLAFFWLALTGVYLWWPRSWHWRGLKPSLLFNFHLRGKARDWNWHNVIGFWSSGGAHRSHAHRRGDVLSMGQRSALHVDGQRAAAKSASPRPCGSSAAAARRGRRDARAQADGKLRCLPGARRSASSRLDHDDACACRRAAMGRSRS